MLTKEDLAKEQGLIEWAAQPTGKYQTHVRQFNREQFYYNLDEVARQAVIAARTPDAKVTYADHIKAVKTARFMLNKDNQHAIIMSILSHRWFKDYRAKAFKGTGSFTEDFSFVAARVGNIVDSNTAKIIPADIQDRLASFTEPTLVQVNHLASTVEKVKLSTTPNLTLQDWVKLYNENASETTTYVIAGIKL